MKPIKILGSILIGATIVLAVAIQIIPPASAATSTSITGNWRGSGFVKLKSGARENVRCRVSYGRIAGQSFSLKARCATSGGNFDQTGELKRVSKNRYVGSVRNAQFNIGASVIITVSGRSQNVSISSSEGSAKIRLSRR